MNTALQKVRLYARELRLPTLAQAEAIVRDAQANQWAYEEFLAEVLRTEARKLNSAKRTKGKGALKPPSFR
jgi:hypothetical protein